MRGRILFEEFVRHLSTLIFLLLFITDLILSAQQSPVYAKSLGMAYERLCEGPRHKTDSKTHQMGPVNNNITEIKATQESPTTTTTTKKKKKHKAITAKSSIVYSEAREVYTPRHPVETWDPERQRSGEITPRHGTYQNMLN